MDIAGALQLAGQFGPMGLLVAYLIWREVRDDRWRKEQHAERVRLYQADIEAREKLAVSLSTLSTIIQGRGHV